MTNDAEQLGEDGRDLADHDVRERLEHRDRRLHAELGGVIKEPDQALADPPELAHPRLEVEQPLDALERPLELRPSVMEIREVADDRVQQRDEHLGKLGVVGELLVRMRGEAGLRHHPRRLPHQHALGAALWPPLHPAVFGVAQELLERGALPAAGPEQVDGAPVDRGDGLLADDVERVHALQRDRRDDPEQAHVGRHRFKQVLIGVIAGQLVDHTGPVDDAEAPQVVVDRMDHRAPRGPGGGEPAHGLMADPAQTGQGPALVVKQPVEQAGLERRRPRRVRGIRAEVDAGVGLDQLAPLVADAPAAVTVEHHVDVVARRRGLPLHPVGLVAGRVGVDRVRGRVRGAAHA